MAELIKEGSDGAVNFDYGDVSDGFGLETYYLYSRVEASGSGTETTTYHMSKDSSIASTTVTLQLSSGAAGSCSGAISGYTQETDVTFTSPSFKLPKVLNGTAIMDFCFAHQETGGSNATFYPSVKVYHYDGSTETQLGSTWYGQGATSVSSSNVKKRCVAYMALGRKKFRIGDSIRIKLGGAICGGSGSLDNVYIGIDPLNRDGEALIAPSTDSPVTTTTFKVRLPFEVQV